MSNTTLFPSKTECMTKNAAGGKAYALKDQDALTQYAFTGTLANTHYVTAKSHLETVLNLCKAVDPEVVAKIAIASRTHGYMKDMPAMLLAYLNATDTAILKKVFSKVIDNGKMLKNFVQIVRSGVTGRRGFGNGTKNLIRQWLESRDDVQLLYDSIGGEGVSLDEIIHMVRPKPANNKRSAMYAWLCGAKIQDEKLVREVYYPVDRKAEKIVFQSNTRVYDVADLPPRILELERYFADETKLDSATKVPFRLLTRLKLSKAAWAKICQDMSWQELRQNLETLTRHGVFEDPQMVSYACKKLRDPKEIAKSKVFPYQLLAAYLDTGETPVFEGVTKHFWTTVKYYMEKKDKKGSQAISIPLELRYALQDAMEVAIENVPQFKGQSYLCVDVSGSMGYPVTGERDPEKVHTKVRCLDAAGLMAAAFLRRNPMAKVLPFNTKILDIKLNPMDRVMINAEKFVKYGQGGTDCSEPLRVLNEQKAMGDTIIFLSDNESWLDKSSSNQKDTSLVREWNVFKERNPNAKMVNIDITPKKDSQTIEAKDSLLIGGFSDQVFKMVDQFINGDFSKSHWKDVIDNITI